jgi:hypothetical protein
MIERERAVPEELWLFCRIQEWAPARSGIWQYYEGLPEAKFQRMLHALESFGLMELAEKYRLGKNAWSGHAHAADLDKWTDANEEAINGAAWGLALRQQEWLQNHI